MWTLDDLHDVARLGARVAKVDRCFGLWRVLRPHVVGRRADVAEAKGRAKVRGAASLAIGRVERGVHVRELLHCVGPVGVRVLVAVVAEAAHEELADGGRDGAPWAFGGVLPWFVLT